MTEPAPMGDRHITSPAGFVAGATHCGLKSTDQEDLCLLAANRPAACAVLLTTNQITGAPVQYVRGILPRGYGMARGIVVNAGCSNVCNGPGGLADAEEMARLAARRVEAGPEEMLVASTGIIGQRLPMDKIRAGIETVGRSMGTDADQAVARAILTTDTRPKVARRRVTIDGAEVVLGGIAKGAGMIAPSMATMIALVTTDVAVAPRDLRRLLKRAADTTFNAVTVDSDTSTSDTLAVLASGASGVRIRPSGASMETFAEALTGLGDELARGLVADGEGATRIIEVAIGGARSGAQARLAAKSVADSPLVKTAIHGQDPNWGRIVMALGKSPAKVDADRLTVRIAGTTVFANGTGQAFDARALADRLGDSTVRIEADLGLGSGSFTALTCDLSREYIAINADYHT